MITKVKSRILTHKVRSIIILLVVVGGIWKLIPASSTQQPITAADLYTVKRGTIENTMKVTGKTSLTNQQNLTFAQPGKVTKIYVNQGDKVKKGDLLAEVDTSDIALNIAQQRISVQNAQINYDKLFTSTKPTDLLQQQNTVADTQRKLITAQQNLTNLTGEMQRKITDQQATIQHLQDDLVTMQAQGDSSSLNSYSSAAADAGTDALDTISQLGDAITTFDTILKTNRPGDQSLIYLGAKNPQTLSDSQLDLQKLKSAFADFQLEYSTFNSTSVKSLDVILALQNKNKEINNVFVQTTQDMLLMVNASIPDSSYLPESTISSYRSTINGLNSKAISSLNSINTAIKNSQNSVSDLTQQQNNILSAQHQLTQLQQDYVTKIQSAQNDIISYQSTLALQQATLTDLEDGPNSNDVALQRNSISNAQISLQKLQNQLKDYQIRAEFDGDIVDVGFSVGDTISTNSTASATQAVTVSNANLYEISMLIDQIDIVKIKQGQEVRYTFDAYPGKIFTGMISDVVPTPTTEQGVVSFTVKVVGQQGDVPIYDQMTANVEIIIENKDNVIVVPTTAISGSGSNKIVEKYENGTPTRTRIETGVTDGKQTEVISGLNEGDVILLTRYSSTQAAAGGFSLFGGAGANRQIRSSAGTPPPQGGTTRTFNAGGGAAPAGGN